MRACSEVGSVLPRGAPAPSVAAAVRGRRPALVVSLDGYDAGHRSDALSLLRGRARIASWFGFLATTGAPWVDFVISASEGNAASHSTRRNDEPSSSHVTAVSTR